MRGSIFLIKSKLIGFFLFIFLLLIPYGITLLLRDLAGIWLENEVNGIELPKENKVKVECFEGLIVDLARKYDAISLIKGVRGPVDYDYEAQMAGMNTVMCPDLETIFLMSKPEFSFIHSSLVKQISLMGGDVTGFVSESIKNELKSKS